MIYDKQLDEWGSETYLCSNPDKNKLVDRLKKLIQALKGERSELRKEREQSDNRVRRAREAEGLNYDLMEDKKVMMEALEFYSGYILEVGERARAALEALND